MNKIFRVIWNHATNSWTVVSELSHVKSKAKSSSLTKIATAVVLTIGGVVGTANAADNHVVVEGTSTAATASGVRAIAVGVNATASGIDSTSVGTNSSTSDVATYSIAIGDNATAVGARDIFIGRNAGVNSTNSGATTSAVGSTYNNIGIGEKAGSNISASNIIALGTNSATGTSAGNNIAIGSGSNSDLFLPSALNTSFNVAVGERTVATGGSSTAVGYYANATGSYATAVGPASDASGRSSFAGGSKANASGAHSTAIGSLSNASGAQANAIGYLANAAGQDAAAYGSQANASGGKSIATGYRSTASGASSVAVGSLATATDINTIAVGTNANASAGTAIAVGLSSKASGGQAVAVGRNANASSNYTVAVGGYANAVSDNSTAVGNLAVANNAYDVALGANSQTSAVVNTTEATVNGVTYSGFAGTTANSTVSVGTEGNERTITNVAAGRISATSTDAINGSQLYMIASELTDLIDSIPNAAASGGNWTISTDANGTGVSTYTANTNSTVTSNQTVTYTAGNNIVISGEGKTVEIATSMTPTFDTVQVGGSTGPVISSTTDGDVKVAKADGSAAKITNVAAGTADTDAVNVSQLKQSTGDINNNINRNKKEHRAGIAGANAAAGLPQVYLPGKSMVAASVGTFKNEGAVAVGYSRASDNGKVILKLQGNANTRGDFGGAVGMGYQW
ncbi:YadA-like family protein [Glaesserella sp.]|uniref:YadA-like family protein n=1 Tax=Glaesserella sp. TaxID=2094731 RepID=UPI0035A1503C